MIQRRAAASNRTSPWAAPPRRRRSRASSPSSPPTTPPTSRVRPSTPAAASPSTATSSRTGRRRRCCMKKGGVIDPAFPSRRLGRLQAHESRQQRIEAGAVAGVEIDAAHLLHQALEALELLEAQEERVLLHELRGVEERTRRRGLLLAADQVGLCRPLRLHHLVHELADLAVQDHVLHAELRHLDAALAQAR